MLDTAVHHASRLALSACIGVGAFLVCACSYSARAGDVDPLPGSKQTADRSAVLNSAATTAHKNHSLAFNYSRGSNNHATSRAVPSDPNRVRGIKITPASASWKVNGLNPQLVQLMVRVQVHYGRSLHIISGCRSKKHNRRVGGATRSQHLHCKAVDFQIPGVSKYKLAAYLRQMPGRGGVGTYCKSRFVHLDVGPKRQWHWKCTKRNKYKKQNPHQRYTSFNK